MFVFSRQSLPKSAAARDLAGATDAETVRQLRESLLRSLADDDGLRLHQALGLGIRELRDMHLRAACACQALPISPTSGISAATSCRARLPRFANVCFWPTAAIRAG